MIKKLKENFYWFRISKLNLAIIPVQNKIDELEAELGRLFNKVVQVGPNPSSVVKNHLLLEHKRIQAELDSFKLKRSFINYKINVYTIKIKGLRAQ